MTRAEFVDYLLENDCVVVRIANQGYNVMRHKPTGRMSGLPATDPPFPATICRTCKTLGVPTPEVAKKEQELIDKLHENYGSPREDGQPSQVKENLN